MTMGSRSLWLRLLISLCVLSNIYSDMDLVDDPESQIPEFLFDCDTEPWITDCKSDVSRTFFMLIDEKGNYLEEVTNKRDPSNSTRLVSHRRKAERPAMQEITETPSFLFQLQYEDFSTGTFYIITSSGKLLAADYQNSPDLVLTKDKCTNSDFSPSPNSSNKGLSLVISSTYDCDQAKWKLWKIHDKFLSIESSYKRGFFLDVKRDKVVRLDGIQEWMTGIKTSFLSGPMVTLERTAGEHPGEGIGRDDYGDVVLHYTDRKGIDQEAYVCDYEWGLEDANSICRHLNYEGGIPTYDGRYSETNNPEYAVSGVRCDGQFKDCKFRTICGTSDPNCLVQQSMKQFKGKGYACNKGSKTDAAGVICGNQTTITSLLHEQIECNRGSIEKNKRSVAQMYYLQKLVSATGSKMFENKHWFEYLLPMPMAISLMSTLLLVSSQFDRDVELTKSSSGQWEHLKYDGFQANLLFMSNNVKNNFQLSTLNMGVIKVNSRKVHKNMKLAVGYAFSTDKFETKTLFPRYLRYIAEDNAKSTRKAEEVSAAFRKSGYIIEELLKALNDEILKSDIKGQDLKATFKYLRACFKHLNFLQLQWDSLRMFFQKLTKFLKDMKIYINRMKDFYSDIGAITLDQPLSKSFKERLQTKIVEGLANNLYVMRIAFFYTKIAEEGLLEKKSMIGSNLKKIKSKSNLERYKTFIEDDAVMTQERIKRKISKEEAKIIDKITNEVSSIKNYLACQLGDRKKLHEETKLTLEAMDKLLSSENNEKNVIATMESATEEEMQTMTLFDEGKLGLNDIVGDEEEDVDDFMEW